MPPSAVRTGSRGHIVAIGGAEDKVSDRAILRRFVEVAGGAGARLVVIPTASELPDTGARYADVFRDLGVAELVVLDIKDRAEATSATVTGALEAPTGVFFTGGNQLRLSTVLGGTEVARRVRRLHGAGAAIGGTSAGAAFMSEHMIAYGRDGSTPYAGQVTLSPGLGLTNRVVIDQHFRQRDRLGRLLAALAYNPFAIGLGLDEDTAAFIAPDLVVEVVGNGGITVVDVSDLAFSSMADAREGQAVELVGIRLHVLAHGGSFDLTTRVARPGARPG